MNEDRLFQLMRDYESEQNSWELSQFCDLIKKQKPKTIVEIGIKFGGTMRIWSELMGPDGLVIGIDPGKRIKWDLNSAVGKAVHIHQNSHSTEAQRELIVALNGRQIDVLFIDGDHSYDGALHDYEDYGPLVPVGGIIAVHDIYYLTEVIKFWRELSLVKKHEIIKRRDDNPNGQPCGIGIGYIIKGEQ